MHPEPDHKFTVSAKGLTLQLSGRIMALSGEETQTGGSGFFWKKKSERSAESVNQSGVQ